MEKNNQKRISCKRCQQRKIRCSRTFPCSNCSTATVKCEFRESDFKRPPVSREYVAALESRITSLESLLSRLKEVDGDERTRILDDLEVQDHVPSFSSLPLEDERSLSEAMTRASFQEMTDGSMVYHGPTSIFRNEAGSTMYPTSSSENSKPSPFQEDKSNLTNQTIRLCIGLFFFWQYPLFMFIDREAFIQEFEDNPIDGDFCSPPLIYAAAAVGALMSTDPEVKATSSGFAEIAQSILLTDELGVPRPTSVQALLCLAYYEVGQGNMSKGWLFSGMAIRMGQDLGFQRDPTHYTSDDKETSSSPFPFNSEYRRRIYWGSFVTDKMFSLFLGRPAFMYENDADVNLSEPLPHDPPIWENWLVSHELGFLKTKHPGPKLTLVFNQQVELARIVHDMLSQTFAPKKMKDPLARRWNEVSLNKMNARLVAWHEALPNIMRWKKWFTNKDILQINVAILHIFYHSARICLNLPFIASVKNIPFTSEESNETSNNTLIKSFKICQASAEGMVDVLQRFKSQHTLGNAPLLFVGATIVAMNAVLVTSLRHGSPPQFMKDTLLPVLDSALEEMSVSWKLAEEARLKFRNSFGQKQHQHPGSSSETTQCDIQPEAGGPYHHEIPVVNPAQDQHPVNASGVAQEIGSLGAATQRADIESPELHVWEPWGVLGDEAAYWVGLGDGSYVGSNLALFDGVMGFDWPDQPPASEPHEPPGEQP